MLVYKPLCTFIIATSILYIIYVNKSNKILIITNSIAFSVYHTVFYLLCSMYSLNPLKQEIVDLGSWLSWGIFSHSTADSSLFSSYCFDAQSLKGFSRQFQIYWPWMIHCLLHLWSSTAIYYETRKPSILSRLDWSMSQSPMPGWNVFALASGACRKSNPFSSMNSMCSSISSCSETLQPRAHEPVSRVSIPH